MKTINAVTWILGGYIIYKLIRLHFIDKPKTKTSEPPESPEEEYSPHFFLNCPACGLPCDFRTFAYDHATNSMVAVLSCVGHVEPVATDIAWFAQQYLKEWNND